MMTLSLNGHICCLISFQPCICVAILSRLLHRLMIAPSDRPFIRWATALPHATAGSLCPAFAPARLV